jgi:hypothetical protein
MCCQYYTGDLTEESGAKPFVMKTLRKIAGVAYLPPRQGKQEPASKSKTPPPGGVCFFCGKTAYFAGRTAFG